MAFSILKRERKAPSADAAPELPTAAPASSSAQPVVGAVDGWIRSTDRPGFLVDGWCTSDAEPTVLVPRASGSPAASLSWILRYPRPDAEQALLPQSDWPASGRLGFVLFVEDTAASTSAPQVSFEGAVISAPAVADADPARIQSVLLNAWHTKAKTADTGDDPPPPEVLQLLPSEEHEVAAETDWSTGLCDPLLMQGHGTADVSAESELLSDIASASDPAPQRDHGDGSLDGWVVIRNRPGFLIVGWCLGDKPVIFCLDERQEHQQALELTWLLRYSRPDVAAALGIEGDGDGLGFIGFIAWNSLAPPPEFLRLDDRTAAAIPASPPAYEYVLQGIVANLWGEQASLLVAGFAGTPPPEILTAVAVATNQLPQLAAYAVDRAAEVPGLGVLLDGWMVELGRHPVQLLAVDETSDRWVDLSSNWHRTERPDVVPMFAHQVRGSLRAPGFAALLPLPQADAQDDVPPAPRTLAVYAVCKGQVAVQHIPVEPVQDSLARIRAALSLFRPGHRDTSKLMSRQLGPAINAWLDQHQRPADAARSERFGPVPAQPRLSIVVPVWGRHDLMRVQLARLARDPDLHRGVELIYVVDDKRLIEPVWAAARTWLSAYGLPFRLLATAGDSGYANAVNFGAQQANGEFLLLLDADCLPDQDGWLQSLQQALERTPGCGATGPKLVFPDDTVQSAALRRAPHPQYPEFTTVVADGRGHLDRDPARDSRVVDAVSGACLMTRRASFVECGGFEPRFLFGHHEDAVYCHRLALRGLHTRLLPGTRLYHLEQQARAVLRQTEPLIADPNWKAGVDLFNAWQLSQRLNEGLDDGAGA